MRSREITMSIKDCKARVAAAMEGASEEEVVAAFKEAARIMDDNKLAASGEIAENLDKLVADVALAKKIEVRNKAINELAKVNIRQHVAQFDDKAEGFESLLVGVNRVKGGSRDSVAANQEGLREKYLTGYINELDNLGKPVFDLYTSGKIDDDIVRALWDIENPDALKGIDPNAISIAKVIYKHQEAARVDANKAGAFIKKSPSYVMRQSHDMDKIRKTPQAEWVKEMSELLDSRTFAGVDNVDEFMNNVYDNLSTGIHLGNGSVGGKVKAGSAANRMSQERVLHFKDAESFLKYHSKYGRGGLSDNVMMGMIMSAQNTALMQKLGTNPEVMLNQIFDEQLLKLKKTDHKAAQKLASAREGYLDNQFKTVSGQTSIPANHIGASVGQNVRGFNSLEMMGGVVISAIPDVALSGAELRYQGQNMFQAYGKAFANASGALKDLGKSILKRRLDPMNEDKRRVLAELSVSLDSMTGAFRSRFDASGDPMNSRVAEAMRKFFRLNGLTLWTDSMRGGAVIGMAQHLGSVAGKGYNDVPVGLQKTMKLHGIEEGEWELMRSVGTKKFDKVDGEFFTPESLSEIKDGAIKKYLADKDIKATKFQIEKTRDEMQRKLRNYYVDRSQYAVIEPDAKTRATMLRDTQAGTIAGEVMRAVMQFKSFPFAILQKVYGREIRGRDSVKSSALALSEIIAFSTLLGFVSQSASDLSKNKTPRDPADPKAWLAAALKGGGAGIYGDFLFGDLKNRFGGGFMSTAAGPTASQIDKLANIVGQAREGDEKIVTSLFQTFYKGAQVGAGIAFPPATMLNTFYGKAAMDNLIYYNIMESLDSGYKRRLEKRMKRDNDQEFLIK